MLPVGGNNKIAKNRMSVIIHDNLEVTKFTSTKSGALIHLYLQRIIWVSGRPVWPTFNAIKTNGSGSKVLQGTYSIKDVTSDVEVGKIRGRRSAREACRAHYFSRPLLGTEFFSMNIAGKVGIVEKYVSYILYHAIYNQQFIY